MAYVSKLQVIQRGGQNRQYYLICPAPLAAALEMEKGEELAAEELRTAAHSLGRLIGRVDVEDILDTIFREFCVGK